MKPFKTRAASHQPAQLSQLIPRQRWVPGVAFYGGLLLLLVAAVLAALGLAQQRQLERELELREARQARAAVAALADDLGRWLQRDQAVLAALAEQGEVQARLPAATPVRELELVALFPGAQRLLLVPAGLEDPVTDLQPPLGYALVEQLRESARSGRAPPAEVHLPGQPEAHINVLQPVLVEAQVQGHLVLTYPLDHLRGLLNAPQGRGLRLEQRADGPPVTILRSGAVAQDLPTAGVPGSHWLLQLGATPGAAAGPAWGPPMAAFGTVALAVIVLLWLLRRALLRDGETLLALVRAARREQSEIDAPVALGDLRSLMFAAAREARSEGDRRDWRPAAERRDESPAREEEDMVDHNAIGRGAPGPGDELEVAGPVAVRLDGLEIYDEPVAEEEPPLPLPEVEEGVRLDPVILRAYDVRGIVGPALNAGVVQALGRAIGTEAAIRGQHEIVVARDGRLSSVELARALVQGLREAGRDVVDIGRVPTPVMNFATFHLGTGAGVMVTGSHNPADYNGLKIVIGGRTLSGEEVQALGRRVEAGDFVSGQGSYRRQDLLPAYRDRIAEDVRLQRPLKVVVDAGNGVAGDIAPAVLRALGCEVDELFCEVDGRFPNHHPDPTVPANLSALIERVGALGADVGLAFDGDGDRLGVVDAAGNIIWADRQLMMFAAEVLGRHPGADIVFDVKCSADLARVITEHAGVPVMWKTGHSLIKGKLHELDAPLGGELSGHIFFKDRWYGFDDAIYAGSRLLEILAADPRPSDQVFAELPNSLSTPEIRLDLAQGEPEQLMAEVFAQAEQLFPDAHITAIDGIRADFSDGWGLVRASNTTPSLVLRFEAVDEAALARLQKLFRERLQALRPSLELPF